MKQKNCCYTPVTDMYFPWPRYKTKLMQVLIMLMVLLLMMMKVPPSSFRTHTLMQTSFWRQLSSWLRPESATQRKSTRQPDTWKSESRTLSDESNTGSFCLTCLSPSTHTLRRWDTHSQISCCCQRVLPKLILNLFSDV